MLKPIEISPVNTTNKVAAKCEKCGYEAVITMTNHYINTDDDTELKALGYECQKCGAKL